MSDLRVHLPALVQSLELAARLRGEASPPATPPPARRRLSRPEREALEVVFVGGIADDSPLGRALGAVAPVVLQLPEARTACQEATGRRRVTEPRLRRWLVDAHAGRRGAAEKDAVRTLRVLALHRVRDALERLGGAS